MFRFSIRDVLWATALVAMALAWRLQSPAMIGIYQYQEHLHSFQVERLQQDIDSLKERLRACELKVGAVPSP